jgi:hypothetical protein
MEDTPGLKPGKNCFADNRRVNFDLSIRMEPSVRVELTFSEYKTDIINRYIMKAKGLPLIILMNYFLSNAFLSTN